MAGTGPEDVEKRALPAFLDAQRASVLAIVADLAEDTLRTPVLPSGWTPLGMVKHLGFAARHWFGRIAAGSAGDLPWPDMPGAEQGREPFTTGLPTDVVFGFYRDQCERANAIVAATPPSAPPHGRHSGDPGACRVAGSATCAGSGHLDIARELTDTARDLASAPRNPAARRMPNSGVPLQVHA